MKLKNGLIKSWKQCILSENPRFSYSWLEMSVGSLNGENAALSVQFE